MDQRVGGSDWGAARYWSLQADETVQVLGKERKKKFGCFFFRTESAMASQTKVIWLVDKRISCCFCLLLLHFISNAFRVCPNFLVLCFSLFSMDTLEVLAPGECALVSCATTFDSCCGCFIFDCLKKKNEEIIVRFFISASAFALKGIDYDQVPVNLIKDGGQQVQRFKIRLISQTVDYICILHQFILSSLRPS